LGELCLDRAQPYAERKQFEKSEQWFREAYLVRQKYPKTGYGDLTDVETDWGRECVAAGKYGEGRKHLETCYAAMKSQSTKDYRRLIILLQALLMAYHREGDLKGEAGAYADLIGYQKAYESAPDIIATNMDHYADLLEATKCPEEAAQQRKLANEFREKCAP
jgi:tetratricopeptide (TPR) repeat protein